MTSRPSPHSPMTASQYREACERLGISPTYGVEDIGIPRKTGGRYNRGEATVSPAHAALLRALLELQECRERLAALEGREAAE